MNENPVILFDGVCNFCNLWVQFVLKREKKQLLKFATLQSESAKKLLTQYNIDSQIITSLIFIENGIAYSQSTAALRISKYLDGEWKLLYGFLIVPAFLRNGVYNLVAKNRYQWFGKKEKCWVPTPELKARFLE